MHAHAGARALGRVAWSNYDLTVSSYDHFCLPASFGLCELDLVVGRRAGARASGRVVGSKFDNRVPVTTALFIFLFRLV